MSLDDDEIEKLKLLIPIAEQLAEEAEYRAAQRLVLQTWRKTVIFIGGFLAALYLLRDNILKLLGVDA